MRDRTIIETLGGKNPYTNEEIKDRADIEEYLAMKEIAKNGGDPVTDFSKFQKQRERENAERFAKKEEEREWYSKDRENFLAKYPNINVQALIDDKLFQKFASGKVGIMPLSEIYSDFIDISAEYEKKAKQIAKQALANQNASPGSLSSTNPSGSGYFTREQVLKMDKQEIRENYERIRASMKKWK